MKLSITGGCGFLGSNMASDAITRGDELIVFVSDLTRAIKQLGWQPVVASLEGDTRMFEWVGQTQ